MRSLEGRLVLVTGASRGIGGLIALFMARHGCNLVLHSRDIRHTETVLRQVLAQGVQAYCLAADLADPAQVKAMLNDIEARRPGVDVLFNNAGVQGGYRRDFWHTPVTDFSTSFQVDCMAPAKICYRLIPAMIERGFGRIINITSGIRDEPEQAGYSASKPALDKFTRDLGSRMIGQDVLINLADPGWCRTDLGGPG